MDLRALLRDAWHITRTQPTLWALHVLLLLIGLPAVIVSGGFGALGALRELDPALLPVAAQRWLTSVEPGALTAFWVGGVLLVVVFSALTQIVLAAIYRTAAHALKPGPALTLPASLALGRARLTRIVVLSLTLGSALSILALLPILLSTLGAPAVLAAAVRPILAPLNVIGGLVFLLLVLAVSLEDVRGREAPGRAWAVFKRGWAGFVLVLALTLVISLAIGVLATPGLVVVSLVWIWPDLGLVAPITTGAVALVCGLPLFAVVLGGAIYTNILQALVYRDASSHSN
ncbi:MAG: hypothetical protein JNL73_12360 [Anaerolineales bacterium]|nr:hypothetical protein [Anaerolineales bacterium]